MRVFAAVVLVVAVLGGVLLLQGASSRSVFVADNEPPIRLHKACPVRVVKRHFRDGEEVTYVVYYHWGFVWVRAGETVITVSKTTYKGKDAYYFRGFGKTYKSWEWFYKVRDTYESWMDAETFLPLRFRRDVYEGGYTIFEDIRFDHDSLIAWERKDTEKTFSPYSIEPCTFDVLSAVFYVRSMDLSQLRPGDKFDIKVFIDKELYPLKVTYLGKDTLKTDLGTYRVVVMMPELIPGTIFKAGAKMFVWATDDDARLVLQAAAPVIVGEIRAELKSYKNNKYPVTARID